MNQKRLNNLIKELQDNYSKIAFQKTLEYFMNSINAQKVEEIWNNEFFSQIEKTAEGIIEHYLRESKLKDFGYVCSVTCVKDQPGVFDFRCWIPKIMTGANG